MPPSSISIHVPYIKTLHKQPYPGISPLRPELNQAGRTGLIVGGSSGIGFAIAKAFVHASASHVIITGRRETALDAAVTQLLAEVRDGAGTTVSRFVSDMADPQESEKFWNGLKRDGIVIDVLVLNAMKMAPNPVKGAAEEGPILDADLNAIWGAFESNVRGLLDYTQRFHSQGHGRSKYVVNVSTSSIHNSHKEPTRNPTYALTKASGTLMLQQIAKDVDAAFMQLVSFNPGVVLTQAVRSAGWDETALDFDDENLAGQFAVWCASEEARFLHGRFVLAWWDVDELKTGEVRARIDSGDEYHFLRLGVVGL